MQLKMGGGWYGAEIAPIDYCPAEDAGEKRTPEITVEQSIKIASSASAPDHRWESLIFVNPMSEKVRPGAGHRTQGIF
jgi:hypothetical protein